MTYTFSEIEKHWTDYKAKKALKVLTGGKWMLIYPPRLNAAGGLEGTRAESVKLNQVVSFPTYLRKYAEV
jgi:hypothetical protein